MTPLLAIPGHLCDARLYAPVRAISTAPFAWTDLAPPEEPTIAAMADAILAAAPPHFALIGLSMGGMVAMEILARAPERVAGALLIATDPTPARDRERAWRAELRARVAAEGVGAFVDDFLPRCFPPDSAALARLGPAAGAMMREAPAARFMAQAAALDARPDCLAALAGCAAPTEILVGARDRVCPPLLHRPLAAAMRAAALVDVPGAGHLLTLEAPEAAAAALDRLAARLA